VEAFVDEAYGGVGPNSNTYNEQYTLLSICATKI